MSWVACLNIAGVGKFMVAVVEARANRFGDQTVVAFFELGGFPPSAGHIELQMLPLFEVWPHDEVLNIAAFFQERVVKGGAALPKMQDAAAIAVQVASGAVGGEQIIDAAHQRALRTAVASGLWVGKAAPEIATLGVGFQFKLLDNLLRLHGALAASGIHKAHDLRLIIQVEVVALRFDVHGVDNTLLKLLWLVFQNAFEVDGVFIAQAKQ